MATGAPRAGPSPCHRCRRNAAARVARARPRQSAILHVSCLKWWLPPFFPPPAPASARMHPQGGEGQGRSPLHARAPGTGAKMELEGEIKGGEGGEAGKDAPRLVRPSQRWLALCVLRKGEAGRPRGGKNGGKEGEEKEHLGEDGEGQGCAGVRGKIFPSFFTDPPSPSPQSRFDFSHRSSQPPRMQMTFIMQMHANQV